MRRRLAFLIVLLVQAFSFAAWAHTPGEGMSLAASNFLAALTPEQSAKAIFDFKNDERFNWHFVPKPREGIALKDLTPAQNALAHALLSSGLSQRGYAKAQTI